MAGTLRMIAVGVAAGLAGRAARDAVDALSRTITGRAPRSTPEPAAAGLRPLLDVAASVVVGAALGGAKAAGWRPGPASGWLIAASAAFWADVPLTVLSIDDWNDWGVRSWVGRIGPHLAYGFAAAAVLRLA